MTISTRAAREIRSGIMLARDVLAKKRAAPRGLSMAFDAPLWEQGYHHEINRAVRDGRLRPPRGPSGVPR